MTHHPHLTSTLRRPLRTLMLTLLIAALSFAFVFRAAEYLVVNREIDALGGYYRSIGTLRNMNEAEGFDHSSGEMIVEYFDITEGVSFLEGNEYVDYTDTLGGVSAVMDGIYNADVDGSTSDHQPLFGSPDYATGIRVSDVLLSGTLTQKVYIKSPRESENYTETIFGYDNNEFGLYYMSMKVDTVIEGFPEYVSDGDTVHFLYIQTAAPEEDRTMEEWQVGSRYMVKAYYDPYYSMHRTWQRASDNLILRQIDDNVWYIPLADGETFDFDAPEHASIKNDLEILRQNLHSVQLIGTGDMSSLPETLQSQRKLYLTQGRWLNRDDEMNAKSVCVIHNEFARMRGLSIGDTITVTMRDMEGFSSYYGYISGDEAEQRWKSFATHRETLEIVGLYANFSRQGSQYITSDSLDVYIPHSVLPSGFNYDQWMPYSGNFSFVLKSSREQAVFVDEYRDDLAQLNIELSFIENNADGFWASVTPIEQSTLLNLIIFASVSFAGLLLTVFIYLWVGRKDFAVSRALGMAKGKASLGMLWPAMVMGLCGVLGGGIPAWIYALKKAGETLSVVTLPDGAVTNSGLSMGWLCLLCAVVFGFMFASVGVGILRLSRRSVLSLLQGMTVKQKREAAENVKDVTFTPQEAFAAVYHPPVSPAQTSQSTQTQKSLSLAASARFVRRHILRAPVKSLLVIVIAAGFLLAFGWILGTIERSRARVDELYDTTMVDLDIMQRDASVFTNMGNGIINETVVNSITDSGFMKDSYLEAEVILDLASPYEGHMDTEVYREHERAYPNPVVVGFTQPEAYFAANGLQADIQYAEGWDESIFGGDWSSEETGSGAMPVILPVEIMVPTGLSPGDELFYLHNRFYGHQQGRQMTGRFVIAGWYTVTGDSTIIGSPPIMMPLSALQALHEANRLDLYYSTAHFTLDPARNRELDDFRHLVTGLLNQPGAGLLSLRSILWDEELRLAIAPLEQTIRLLTILFPVTSAISVLIAAGLSILLLLLTTKEAAFLRVLGATKRRVRWILCSGQMVLCLLGLAVGLAGVALLGGSAGTVFGGSLLLCGGLYLGGTTVGAVLAAVMVVRRKPMALLQVKE